MKNVWQKLKKPFFILAPMDDVTDTVFREVVVRAAAPDLTFTEFANADGFMHPKGRSSVSRKLLVNKSERNLKVPIIAQIWGANPETLGQMTAELAGQGVFAGIDINMGCPERGICRRGCCAGLIKEENWPRAAEIIKAVKANAGSLPVSVKTRLGFGKQVTEEWVEFLLGQGIDALTLHARTAKEMSKVPARWEEIAKAVKIRDRVAPNTLIIGNGDVLSRKQGEELASETGADGIMVGRGIFHNLLLFDPEGRELSRDESFDVLLQHLDLYEATWGESKSYDPLKKFFKVYISGFDGASELRTQMMQTKNPAEAREVIQKFRTSQTVTV
ncbi:MAG TPA: tRNA-dihydrouridine synthase [Candidatus Dormibacteraeota bacterium]|nr:tRNA-dihydrouridine synthase [Candidatus Dormibacteraeota bacterium]